MNPQDIHEFLVAIDDELASHASEGETLDLHLLGSTPLILSFAIQLMTKDIDVIEQHDSRLLEIAIQVFGRNGSKRASYPLYLETVSSGLPPLPIGYQGRRTEISGPWHVLRVRSPEVHDLIVTKLRRFHPGDRRDIRTLCDLNTIEPDLLRDRLESAHLFSDQDDPSVVNSFRNLVEVLDYLDGRTLVV